MLSSHKKVIAEEKFISYSIRSSFSLACIVTFIVDMHSFSFAAELLLLPFIIILHVMLAISTTKPQYSSITQTLQALASVVIIGYVGNSVILSIRHADIVFSFSTLREFCIPIILLMMYIPFIFFLSVLFAYEYEFSRLKFGINSEKLRAIAKIRAVREFKLNAKLLRQWTQTTLHLHPTNPDELQKIFAETKTMARRKACPPVIPQESGWSPYAAVDYLAEEGLRIKEYNHIAPNEWSGWSDSKDMDTTILPNKIVYHITGNDLSITKLELVASITTKECAESAKSIFINIAQLLLKKALNLDAESQISQQLINCHDFKSETPFATVACTRTDLDGVGNGRFLLKLEITSFAHTVDA